MLANFGYFVLNCHVSYKYIFTILFDMHFCLNIQIYDYNFVSFKV